jgi:hypothetical protein
VLVLVARFFLPQVVIANDRTASRIRVNGRFQRQFPALFRTPQCNQQRGSVVFAGWAGDGMTDLGHIERQTAGINRAPGEF